MINTVNIKEQTKTVFTIGAEQPQEVILILGSCRCVAYLNYLNRYNESHGQPFRIHFIEPFNYHFNETGNIVPLEPALLALEDDPRIRQVLGDTTIFIHEHFQYFGLFNSSREAEKNIWQFGMNPKMEISVPNFHDRFVLFQEQINVREDVRENARRDIQASNRLSEATIAEMKDYGERALDRFYEICALTSIPEMAQHVNDHWRERRFFWTGNHVSRHYTTFAFERMNDRFFRLALDESFWVPAREEDMFAFPNTPVTQYDVDAYGLTWSDPVVPLSIP